MPRTIPAFDHEKDFKALERLVGQQSYSIRGQEKISSLVEDLIRDRTAQAIDAEKENFRKRKRSALSQDEEQKIERALDAKSVSQVVPPDMITEKHMREYREEMRAEGHPADSVLKPGWRNTIFTKGDRSAPYHVVIPSHLDTVKFLAPSQLRLQRSGDRLYGLGVWDMKAGVLNAIALASEIIVPEGMCVHFPFTVYEETNSSGADYLIKEWADWNKVDAVLSNEIGPLPGKLLDADGHMRILLGRLGRQKFTLEVTFGQSLLTHFAKPDADDFDVNEIASQMYHELKEAFYGMAQVTHPHPLFGASRWGSAPWESNETQEGRPVDKALFRFDIKAQGMTFAEQQKVLDETLQKIVKKYDLPSDISVRLRQRTGVVSYDPFTMPLNAKGVARPHAFVDRVRTAVRKVTGKDAIPTFGASVADENLYAEALLRNMHGSFEGSNGGVISVPPRGNKAHESGEWVSISSIMETREVLRWLLTHPDGLAKLAWAKAT